MFIKKISLLCAICSLFFLIGCANHNRDWGYEYGELPPAGAPAAIDQDFYDEGHESAALVSFEEPDAFSENIKTVAVLLPLSGPNAAIGQGIQHAIEIAFFQKQPNGVMVAFNDMSGDRAKKIAVAEHVISRNPDMILGPIFAEDVEILRGLKPDAIPAITFTSDQTALSGGVFTLALLPNQGAEAVTSHMAAAGASNILILSPDTKTGYMLANAALESAYINNMRVTGMYYYDEGDMGSQKSVAERASMFGPREKANNGAKEILSDILLKKQLPSVEKAYINKQLEALNKSDTVGKLPYDAVLFLGNAADSKALASFLRYYDVPTNTIRFYGTAMWDADSMFSDMTLNGAEYAALPSISLDFARTYTDLMGVAPNRMNSMGYDAAMLSIGALSSSKSLAAYLLDPSGFKGLDGLVRLRPNGADERALQIMRLDGSGAPKVKAPAARNFINPLYNTTAADSRRPSEIEITNGINPMDYISLPKSLAGQYSAKTYRLSGASAAAPVSPQMSPIYILPEDDSDISIMSDPNFQPYQMDTIEKTYMDSVTVTTR
ncbi:MAG: penicillin-binding protein activator [Rickettsiales bacterium]|jgi:ABC-type branched-subunit amino acid transport system substrate-binding protein|nr:penicillin-binding protein activator [Rickettsiales bacterium]